MLKLFRLWLGVFFVLCLSDNAAAAEFDLERMAADLQVHPNEIRFDLEAALEWPDCSETRRSQLGDVLRGRGCPDLGDEELVCLSEFATTREEFRDLYDCAEHKWAEQLILAQWAPKLRSYSEALEVHADLAGEDRSILVRRMGELAAPDEQSEACHWGDTPSCESLRVRMVGEMAAAESITDLDELTYRDDIPWKALRIQPELRGELREWIRNSTEARAAFEGDDPHSWQVDKALVAIGMEFCDQEEDRECWNFFYFRLGDMARDSLWDEYLSRQTSPEEGLIEAFRRTFPRTRKRAQVRDKLIPFYK